MMRKWGLQRSTFSASSFLMMLPALILIGALFVLPLMWLAAVSFGDEGDSLAAYKRLFSTWSYSDILLRTLRISALVTFLCVVFGYPIGYVLAFARPGYQAILSLLVLLPFWTSALVRNFAWIYMLGDGGLLSSIAGFVNPRDSHFSLLYNEIGVAIGMVSTLMPFMVFPVFLSISSQGRAIREAAASLGATPARMFLAITWPLSRNGVVVGSLLVFVIAVGFFVTPALLGGGRVLTVAIFITQQVENFIDWPLAAAAGMILLVIVLVLLELFRRASGGNESREQHVLD